MEQKRNDTAQYNPRTLFELSQIAPLINLTQYLESSFAELQRNPWPTPFPPFRASLNLTVIITSESYFTGLNDLISQSLRSPSI